MTGPRDAVDHKSGRMRDVAVGRRALRSNAHLMPPSGRVRTWPTVPCCACVQRPQHNGSKNVSTRACTAQRCRQQTTAVHTLLQTGGPRFLAFLHTALKQHHGAADASHCPGLPRPARAPRAPHWNGHSVTAPSAPRSHPPAPAPAPQARSEHCRCHHPRRLQRRRHCLVASRRAAPRAGRSRRSRRTRRRRRRAA